MRCIARRAQQNERQVEQTVVQTVVSPATTTQYNRVVHTIDSRTKQRHRPTFLSSTTRSFGPTLRAARAMFARARSLSLSSSAAIRISRREVVREAGIEVNPPCCR